MILYLLLMKIVEYPIPIDQEHEKHEDPIDIYAWR